MRFVPSFQFLRRSSDRVGPRRQDPADLGTAFGLEVSLDDAPPPRVELVLESQRPHPPLDNPMAWVQRARG